MGFGKYLEGLLAERKMTIAQLSRLTGVNRGSLYSIVRRDTTKVDPYVVRCVADALKCDVSAFIPDVEQDASIDFETLLNKISNDLGKYQTITFDGVPMSANEITIFEEMLYISRDLIRRIRTRKDRMI